MALRVYNTLTRKKEDFHKKPGERVTMYVCGPTVYKPSHIGHMVGPIIFDTVKRYLTYLGYDVRWVVNITDVDDKLIVRARELGTTVPELAERMTADYLECLKRLNVTGIDEFPRATQYIGGMIDMIAGLIAKDQAYAAGGDVYFDISKDPDYGKLCNRDPEQLEAGSRIEVSDRKRNPGDFALWKSAKPGEPQWPSPWGPGRPGWHIECSVMSMHLLGETLDIHGGGLDLQFPHHENELAQSEQYTDKPFARFWMHNGLLKMGSGKMAGSIGNVLNVVDALQRISGDALRYAFLSTHYRSPIDLGDWDPRQAGAPPLPPNLEIARRTFETFTRFAERVGLVLGRPFASLTAPTVAPASRTWRRPDHHAEAEKEFRAAMDDDFNTGGAVAVLFELVTGLNRLADEKRLEDPATKDESAKADFAEGAALVKEIGQVLGLTFALPTAEVSTGDAQLMQELIQLIVEARSVLRTEAKKIPGKDDPVKKALFDHATAIRERLAALGIILEDRPGGTKMEWKRG
jgi:cysteinyl-tRNA synthetase